MTSNTNADIDILLIMMTAKKIIEGQLFLGFLSEGEHVEENGRISKSSRIFEATELPDFFTLQGEMQDYRYFIEKHGVQESNKLLLALNDLVASKRTPHKAKLVNAAIKTNVFNLAFMRESGRFFAFHNAETILDGIEDENFSNISTNLSLSYDLAGFSHYHTFDMNFETNSILPKRMCMLIGRNGLGKSQALRAIVNSLIKGDERFFDRTQGRPLISRLLAIATPGETMNTFPSERANKRIKYRRLILNRNARAKNSRGFCELCIQLIRSEESIGEHNRWELFKESINFLPNIKNIVVPLDKDLTVKSSHIIRIKDKYYIPLLKLNHGGEQAKLEIQGAIINNADPMLLLNSNIFPLSSGQLAFIKFLVQACLFVENGTLVLLDEPETHLHPNFISKFVRVLDHLLKLTGSIAIIATHSAYFVREVPKKQVLVFKEDTNGHVNIQNPRLKTFGADVGAISYFVFEDEITNALVEDILEHFPKDLDEQTKFLHELKDELSSDVMMYICRKLDIAWQD
ncbi:AAA family ATPase [Aeromonas enteropelogenes]|uniref:AAA family ATPase n=1 Tax=Aeromonas enteropelogenes TaxID=29489 RepID=UPI003B9FD749